MEITGTLEKTVQLAKPFVTNVKRKVHSAKVCQSKRGAVSAAMHQTNDNASQPPFLAAVTAGVPSSLLHTIENVFINNIKFSALIDTSSSLNFISSKVIAKLKISYQEKIRTVSMATPNLKSKIKGYCILSMTL